MYFFFFVFKQKTAYEMRISDWSSDVCSSDLTFYKSENYVSHTDTRKGLVNQLYHRVRTIMLSRKQGLLEKYTRQRKGKLLDIGCGTGYFIHHMQKAGWAVHGVRSDEHTSELQSLMSIPSAVFCLNKKNYDIYQH